MKRLSCGLDVYFPSEVRQCLKKATDQGFEFICVPLVHPRFKREFLKYWKNREGPLTRSDLVLQSTEWNSLIAGKISPYINGHSECHYDQIKFTLEQELSYGNHLEVPAIIISLKSLRCSNLARIINSKLSVLKSYQIWVSIPTISAYEEAFHWRSDSSKKLDVDKKCTWEWWNNFRMLCKCDKRLGVILEITKTLPSKNELDRWIGEPLKCIVIPVSLFSSTQDGSFRLPETHQMFLKSLAHLNTQIIIKGSSQHNNLTSFKKYLENLWQEAASQNKSKQTSNNIIHFPLQPLSENLDSSTYELFEKDSVKYREYGKAVYLVLQDKFDGRDKDEIINIMVVGAGRGPLVTASLEAAAKCNRKVKVFAVEKNPFALVTLQTQQEELWKNSVEILFGDIRDLEFPRMIDILVSELLGSFGDNELSPEVLDDAQKFLKKNGISIPESYTSFICPVHGSKIYSDLKSSNEKSDCEIPYVVKHKNIYNIAKPVALYTFSHPNYDDPICNGRYKCVTFDVEQNCVLHGFAGFFETVLYNDIKLSIVPGTHTPRLFSWNPYFFPLQDPVYLKSGGQIELHFWRIIGETSVWYEWTITKPVPVPIHNVNGNCSRMCLK